MNRQAASREDVVGHIAADIALGHQIFNDVPFTDLREVRQDLGHLLALIFFIKVELRIQGVHVLAAADHLQLIHLGEDNAHAAQTIAQAGLRPGIIDGWGAGNARQIGAFAQCQFRGGLVKVVLGRRLDAHVAVPHRHQIDVQLHDLRLRQPLVQEHRAVPLLHLALGRGLVITRRQLDHLLGDGGAAVGGTAAVGHRRDEGREDALGIDADIGLEALILNGDKSAHDVRVLHILNLDRLALHIFRALEFCHQAAVHIHHLGRLTARGQQLGRDGIRRGQVAQQDAYARAADEEHGQD